jgi:small subunit ribosomal protein S20
MAHSRTAKKAVRQNVKHRANNRWRLRTMREAIKAFTDKVAHGSADEAQAELSKALRVIDVSASKGVIHKNQAARRKSRLNARMKLKKAGAVGKTS